MSSQMPDRLEVKGDVAIFGLSANPPTGSQGHQGIVQYFASMTLFSELWVLPVYSHIYSSKQNLLPFDHRFNMCELCFTSQSTPQCRVRVLPVERLVSDRFLAIEENAGKRPGTIDTLIFLQELYPSVQFHLILGTDTFSDLVAGKWKQHDMYVPHALSPG